MCELISIILPDRQEAEYARIAVLEMKYVLDLGDIVVAEVHDDGTVKLHQSVQLVGLGTVERGFLGTLVGLIFLSPLFGRTIRGTVNAAGGWQADFGIDEHYMQALASQVEAGNAVLFLQVDAPLSSDALKRLRGVGGTVLRTSLDDARERTLREALEDLRRPADFEYAALAERLGKDRMWCDDRPQDTACRA